MFKRHWLKTSGTLYQNSTRSYSKQSEGNATWSENLLNTFISLQAYTFKLQILFFFHYYLLRVFFLFTAHCQIPCQNGGVCVGPNICNCKKGYVGEYCQKEGIISVQRLAFAAIHLLFALTTVTTIFI